jgi:DNA-binding NtrC family response regulator
MLTPEPNILLVSGPSECSCLMSNLSSLGNVTTAQNLDEAIARLKNEQFDVLFCAWDIAGKSWDELLGMLKRMKVAVPAVVYYRCGGEQEWLRALDAGAFDFLVPPFQRHELQLLLERAVASTHPRKAVA